MYDKRVSADTSDGFEIETNLADLSGAKASEEDAAASAARNIRLLLLRISLFAAPLSTPNLCHAAGAAVRILVNEYNALSTTSSTGCEGSH